MNRDKKKVGRISFYRNYGCVLENYFRLDYWIRTVFIIIMPFSVIILKLIQSTSKRAYKVNIKKNKEKDIFLLFYSHVVPLKLRSSMFYKYLKGRESQISHYVNLNVIENHFYFVLVN